MNSCKPQGFGSRGHSIWRGWRSTLDRARRLPPRCPDSARSTRVQRCRTPPGLLKSGPGTSGSCLSISPASPISSPPPVQTKAEMVPVIRDGCRDISHRYLGNWCWELGCHAGLLSSSVLPQAIAGSCHVPRCAGFRVFPCAPARCHAVRRAQENGFDLPDLAFLDPEHLGDLPGPRIRRAAVAVRPFGVWNVRSLPSAWSKKTKL